MGRWIPAMSRSNVDFPLPLWPMSPKKAPGSMSSEMSRRTQKSSAAPLRPIRSMASLMELGRLRSSRNFFDTSRTVISPVVMVPR
ncbi:MAG: hypothetical protein R2695_03405 [Acidimicrobiales bacterium]